MRRVIWIVLDSFGIGALPDAADYGDSGANTLKSIADKKNPFCIPNLQDLGLGNIQGVSGIPAVKEPRGSFGRLAERSRGKDTITGHWELTGICTSVPFRTFAKFPDSFIKAYEKAIGTEVLGNYAASGTEIIKELGEEHKKTKKPIVYTSADSVFQIAANIDVIPLQTLYAYCRIAREMLTEDFRVGRVIARPFKEKNGVYTRTEDRKDYAVSPPSPGALDYILDTGRPVCAIGKIGDIFNGRGISESVHTAGNADGIDQTLSAMKRVEEGLIFTNLVDFDSKYGHRRDPIGYGACLEEFDSRLPEIYAAMKAGDLLILCADHGNDPCHTGWDHTREYVPVLFFGEGIHAGIDLGTGTFADAGASVCDFLDAKIPDAGASYLYRLLKK
mgnify:CR=1 FL=1